MAKVQTATLHMAARRNTLHTTLSRLCCDLGCSPPKFARSKLVKSSSSSVHRIEGLSPLATCLPPAAASCNFCITFLGTTVEVFRRARHWSCVIGASIAPGARGCGHSFGKAWCMNCANILPCSGTCPSCCSAIKSNFRRSEAERLRGAATVSEGKAATSAAIEPGEATGRAMLRSKLSKSTLHWSTQQKD